MPLKGLLRCSTMCGPFPLLLSIKGFISRLTSTHNTGRSGGLACRRKVALRGDILASGVVAVVYAPQHTSNFDRRCIIL